MKKKYYTIYENRTDEIIASGFLDDCAKQLNTNKRSLSSTISHSLSGNRKKYSIVIELIDKDELDKL